MAWKCISISFQTMCHLKVNSPPLSDIDIIFKWLVNKSNKMSLFTTCLILLACTFHLVHSMDTCDNLAMKVGNFGPKLRFKVHKKEWQVSDGSWVDWFDFSLSRTWAKSKKLVSFFYLKEGWKCISTLNLLFIILS